MRQLRCFLAELSGQHFRQLGLDFKIGNASLGGDHRGRSRSRGHRFLFERISQSQHTLRSLVRDHGGFQRIDRYRIVDVHEVALYGLRISSQRHRLVHLRVDRWNLADGARWAPRNIASNCMGRASVALLFFMLSIWDIKPVYDVIAKIPGSAFPDEWVIRGNHHDGWVNGAEDPISGLDAVLEEGRAFGELLKQGWKPKRAIILCAWDGEEPGLLGSTEWAEEHADELRAHAVAYINSDTNARGYLEIEGSHTLEKFTNEVSRDITDPETKLSAWKRNQLHDIAEAKSAEKRQEIRQRGDLRDIGVIR